MVIVKVWFKNGRYREYHYKTIAAAERFKRNMRDSEITTEVVSSRRAPKKKKVSAGFGLGEIRVPKFRW